MYRYVNITRQALHIFAQSLEDRLITFIPLIFKFLDPVYRALRSVRLSRVRGWNSSMKPQFPQGWVDQSCDLKVTTSKALSLFGKVQTWLRKCCLYRL